MKCVKCNSEIDNDALFCPYCGSPVEHGKVCVKCGKSLDVDSDFCPYCGTKQNNVIAEPEQVKEVVQPQEPEIAHKEVMDELQNPEVEEQLQESEVAKEVRKEPASNPTQNDLADTIEPYAESHNTKKWLWIVGAILLLGILGSVGYYFMNNKESDSSYIAETDSIAEVADSNDADIRSVEGLKTRVNDILSKALKMSDQDAIHTYFSKEYQKLYDKTIELDNISYGGEIGFWEGGIWDGSQDGDPDAFEIVGVSASSEPSVLLYVNFSHNIDTYHSEQKIPMTLVFENDNWYIDDANNIKGQMQEYIKGAEEYSKSEFELSDLMNIQEMGNVSYANNMLKFKGYTSKGNSWVKGKMIITFDGKVLRVEAKSDDGEDPFPKGWEKEFTELKNVGYKSEDSSVGMVYRTDYYKQGSAIVSIGCVMETYVLSIGEQAGF